MKIMTRHFSAFAVLGLAAAIFSAQAADDPPGDAATTVSTDAKAVVTAVKRDAKAVAKAAKAGAQQVAVAAKEVAHEVTVASKEGAKKVADATKRGVEKTKAAVNSDKTDKAGDKAAQ